MLKTKSTWLAWGGIIAACLMMTAVQYTRGEAPAKPTAGQLAPQAAAVVPAMTPMPRVGIAAPSHAQANSPYEVELAVQKARARGDGENEVYRLRAAALSTQDIATLTERERAEKHWQQRVDAWRTERANLNPADAAALRALRERLFRAEEQKLLDAYDQSGPPQLTPGEFAR